MNNTDMTTVDNSNETDAAPKRASRGVRAIGCDLRLGGLSIPLASDGPPMRDGGHANLELRTDMWRFWLEEAIDAAVAAATSGDQILPLYEQYEAGKATEEDLDQLAIRELVASMRAITASAFAIDGFYGSGASARKRSYQAPESGLMVQGPNYQLAMSVSICVGVPACLGAYPSPVP